MIKLNGSMQNISRNTKTCKKYRNPRLKRLFGMRLKRHCHVMQFLVRAGVLLGEFYLPSIQPSFKLNILIKTEPIDWLEFWEPCPSTIAKSDSSKAWTSGSDFFLLYLAKNVPFLWPKSSSTLAHPTTRLLFIMSKNCIRTRRRFCWRMRLYMIRSFNFGFLNSLKDSTGSRSRLSLTWSHGTGLYLFAARQ
jgi:hypothetical protein